MEKADLEYCFVYRPDSLIVNELFADFRKDGSIRMLPVYKHWKPWLENIRCAYTTGWKHYRFFSWMNTGCARDYSLADILSTPPRRDGRKHCIICCNSSLIFLSRALLEQLSKRDDIVMVLLLVDPMSRINSFDKEKFMFFRNGLILTFDPRNAEANHFHLLESYYSMLPAEPVHEPRESVYFCGADKGRLEMIHRVYEVLSQRGIDCDFHVQIPKSRKKERKHPGIGYFLDSIPYQHVINQIGGCSCILDLTQAHQSGVTIRYFEAVCYNKKLLTDNPYVKELPFYDPEYIQVFDDPESIDAEWIKKPVDVDYGYDGRFSPLRLLDAIPSML